MSAGRWIPLDARSSVPATVFRDSILWGASTFVVHEHSFGVEIADSEDIALSHEHSEYRWLAYGAALKEIGASDRQDMGRWENNRAENESGRSPASAA